MRLTRCTKSTTLPAIGQTARSPSTPSPTSRDSACSATRAKWPSAAAFRCGSTRRASPIFPARSKRRAASSSPADSRTTGSFSKAAPVSPTRSRKNSGRCSSIRRLPAACSRPSRPKRSRRRWLRSSAAEFPRESSAKQFPNALPSSKSPKPVESCTLSALRTLHGPGNPRNYGRAPRQGIFLQAPGTSRDIRRDARHDQLAIVKYHRSITHSFVALPFFALLLALLTRPVLGFLQRRLAWFRGLEAPHWALLTVIYGVGIASHIVLDGMTSFGTRMWYPLSNERVAWDLLFIIDFTFTSFVLVPQVIAWIYSDLAKSRRRAVRMWIAFTLGSLVVWLLTRAAGYPFHLWVAALA